MQRPMVDERCVEKDLEGNGRRLVDVISGNFPGGTEENHKNPSICVTGVPVGDSKRTYPEYRA